MHTHWCFTLNNPEHALDVLFEEWHSAGNIRYVAWQLEIGESGTVHYQGYLELSRNQRLSYVRRILPLAHWESRRGTREQARDYARKDDSRLEGPFELGSFESGGSGSRTDIASYANAIKSGANRLALFNEYPAQFLAYQRGTDAAIVLYERKRTWRTALHVYLGRPGCGKTTKVLAVAPNAYWKQSTKWWDNYNGEEDVCLDDFYGWLPFHDLLRLADGTPLQVERKGGQSQFLAKSIYITSNKSPSEWYKNDGRFEWDALFRRITTITVWVGAEQWEYSSYADFAAETQKHGYPAKPVFREADFM